jgi:hypothetical protein
MKNLIIILTLFICSNANGQFKSLDKSDTTNYIQVDDLDELKEFGYNYVGKYIIIQGRFDDIHNSSLSSTPESNKGSSMEGGMSYYDPKKVRELVGFHIEYEEYSTFYNSYGYQKDILDKLRSLKVDDEIFVLGKVVEWTMGEQVGIRVKYVYTLDEYNNSIGETKTDVTSESEEESFFDTFLEKIGMIVIIIIAMGIYVFIKNRNKK